MVVVGLKKEEEYKFMSGFMYKDFVLPSVIESVSDVPNPFEDSFVIYPLQKGFGTTIGNSLRRVLLSSIRGVVFDSVQINGVSFEMSSLSGVIQDVPEICFNIRNVVIKTNLDSGSATLIVKGPKIVTAGDIIFQQEAEIINKDHFLFEITTEETISIKLSFQAGIGNVFYVPESSEQKFGIITLDKHFSPVLSVSFDVTDVMFEGRTDYDKLTININTNGSISPRDSLNIATVIVMNHMKAISTIVSRDTELELQNEIENEEEKNKKSSISNNDLNYNLFRKISDIEELSIRAKNCLAREEIKYVGDLVQLKEEDLVRTPNFGKKSLDEIVSFLNSINLSFGMELNDWPPANFHELFLESQRIFGIDTNKRNKS